MQRTMRNRLIGAMLGLGVLSLSGVTLQAQEGQQTRDTTDVGAARVDTTAQADTNGQAATTGQTADTNARARADTADQDTTKWGHPVERDPEVQNPAGYRGMQRDTTTFPPTDEQPVDTFLQRQGTGVPADTMGYRGLPQPAGETGEQAEQQPRQPEDQQEPGDTVRQQEDGDTAQQRTDDTSATPTSDQQQGTGAAGQDDTASMAGQSDTAGGTRPGETEPKKSHEAERRLQPTDTAGTAENGSTQN